MRDSNLNSFSVLAFVLGVAGCAPVDHVVASHHTSAGTTGDAGTAVGGAATGGTTLVIPFGGMAAGGSSGTQSSATIMGGSSATIMGGSSGSTVVDCATLKDQAAAQGLEITVKNERATPVYVGNRISQCFEDDGLRVYDAQGRQLSLDHGGHCGCGELMEYGSCPVYSCARSSLRRIAPGASITLSWSGLKLVEHDLPVACQRTESRDTHCSQLVPAAPGTYHAVVMGSTDYRCAEGWDPALCDCMATNSCPPYATPVEGAGKLLEASVAVDLTAGKATVVFTEDLGTVPLQDGVLIGDCKALSAEEQTATGCPATQPEPASSCDAPRGTACRYDLTVKAGGSYTNAFGCDEFGKWSAAQWETCGYTCSHFGGHLIDLSGVACERRKLSLCAPELAAVYDYAWTPTKQMLLGDLLSNTVKTCAGYEVLNNEVGLEVEEGCPTRLHSTVPFEPAVATCLKDRLGSVRLDCAQSLTCASYMMFPI